MAGFRSAASRAAAHFLVMVVLAATAPFADAGLSAPLAAQVPDDEPAAVSREDAPRVYIDCRRCDMAHIRREITVVNYVRDPGLAQVHVLITDQGTGSGGRRYTLNFEGRGPFAGTDNSLTYTSGPTASTALERAGLTRMIGLGLVPYVARSPLEGQVEVSFLAAAAPTTPEVDPWKHWTFELYGGGNISAETSSTAWNARYGFYANRVTEEWKIRLRPYFNNNARSVRLEDGEEVRVDNRRHGFESYVIRSLGAHWGAGLFGEYRTSTRDNLRHELQMAPAIEYSFFPYDESSTRQITVAYRIGTELVDYIEETIYEQTREALFEHALEAAVRIRQPWGSIFSSLSGSAYLHDLDHHRLTFNSDVSLSLGHGISLNVGGRYERINDQLSLPRGDASLEDVLLERRRLATSYRVSGSVGLSYTFGSIYTNVVNPRF